MPPAGFSIRSRVLFLVGLGVLVLGGLTFALAQQLSDEKARFEDLWTTPYEWPQSYHVVGLNQDGLEWEIWFESPNRWRTRSPEGFEVSDGITVSAYRIDGNFYTLNPVNATYLQLGIGPLGPRDPEELKRIVSNADSSGAGWSVEPDRFLDRDVDLVLIGKAIGGTAGYVKTLIIDPERMFLLGESLSGLTGSETSIKATIVEYDIAVPSANFVFMPPEGSCLKASINAPCSP